MATGQGGRESNKLHPLPFQKLKYHTFPSGGIAEGTHTFYLCSPWTKEPVIEGNDRPKQSPTFINAEKRRPPGASSLCRERPAQTCQCWPRFCPAQPLCPLPLPLPRLHHSPDHRAPGLYLFPIGHRHLLLCSVSPSLRCLCPSESKGIYSKSCAAAQTPRGSHPWASRCSVTRRLEANELSVGPKAMLGSSLPLSNDAHSGIQNVLRAHYGPDTQAGLKDRKVTRIHEVPAVTELKCKKCLSFPIC